MTELEGIQARVDRLMAASKVALGGDGWGKGHLPGSQRWVSPLTDVEGSVINLRLVIDAYPTFGFEKVIFQVIAYEHTPRPVTRLCFGEDSRHHNRNWKKYIRPANIDLGWIYGPHIHLWADNRHLATNRALPEDLYFAISFPQKIKSFDAVFWHFCGEANIICGETQKPLPPAPDRLI